MAIDRSVVDPNKRVSTGTDFVDLVFKEGVRHQFVGKTAEPQLAILPAFADPNGDREDPGNWTNYRQDTDERLFTSWIEKILIYSFVGKKANILAPQVLGRTRPDPMGNILEAIKNNPDYYPLAGLGPDGKKAKDDEAFRHALIQRPESFYIVNAINLNPEKQTADSGRVHIWRIKETAITGARGSTDWGLFSQLNLTNRFKKGEEPEPSEFSAFGDFLSRYYYWGDITDVQRGMTPCRIFRAKGPNGGREVYNMKPMEDKDLIQPSDDFTELKERYVLEDSLVETPTGELVDLLMSLFSEYPGLLRSAFEGKYPGMDNLLKQAGIIGAPGRVSMAGAPAPAPRAKAPAPAPSTKFAPKATPAMKQDELDLSPPEVPSAPVGAVGKADVMAEAERIARELES